MQFPSKKTLYLPNIILFSTICMLAFSMPTPAHAFNLMDVYMMAKQQDADIHAAESLYNAEVQERPIARANVLPQASIRANTTDVNQETDGATFGISGREVDFNDHWLYIEHYPSALPSRLLCSIAPGKTFCSKKLVLT